MRVGVGGGRRPFVARAECAVAAPRADRSLAGGATAGGGPLTARTRRGTRYLGSTLRGTRGGTRGGTREYATQSCACACARPKRDAAAARHAAEERGRQCCAATAWRPVTAAAAGPSGAVQAREWRGRHGAAPVRASSDATVRQTRPAGCRRTRARARTRTDEHPHAVCRSKDREPYCDERTLLPSGHCCTRSPPPALGRIRCSSGQGVSPFSPGAEARRGRATQQSGRTATHACACTHARAHRRTDTTAAGLGGVEDRNALQCSAAQRDARGSACVCVCVCVCVCQPESTQGGPLSPAEPLPSHLAPSHLALVPLSPVPLRAIRGAR